MILTKLAAIWGPFKQHLSDVTGISPDGFHMHVSLLIMLGAAILLRRRLDSPLPYLTVLAAELINETVDLHQLSGSSEANWAASIHDFLNTMFLPTIILLFLRFTRERPMGAPAAHRQKQAERSSGHYVQKAFE